MFKEKSIFVAALGFLLLIVPIQAQTSFQQQPSERKIGTPLDPDGLVHLNRFTGSVTIVIPLLTIESRGEVGFTLKKTILSDWKTENAFFPDESSTPSVPKGFSGMEIIPGPGVLRGVRTVVRDGTAEGVASLHIETLTRLLFFQNDGNIIEFRDEETLGNPNPVSCESVPKNRGRRFLATDDSGMTFHSNSEIIDGNCDSAMTETFSPSGVLRDRTGRKFVIVDGAVTLVEDRNGNQLAITGDRITDSIGRTYHVGTGGISYIGFGGVPLEIKVRKEKLSNLLDSEDVFRSRSENTGPKENGNVRLESEPFLVGEIVLPEGEGLRIRYSSSGEPVRLSHSHGWEIILNYDRIGADPSNFRALVGYELTVADKDASISRRRTDFRWSLGESETRLDEEIGIANGSVFGRQTTVMDGNPIAEEMARFQNPNHLRRLGVGLPRKIYQYAEDPTVPDTVIEHEWRSGRSVSNCLQCTDVAFAEVITETVTRIPSSGESKKERFVFDEFLNLTDVFTFDIGLNTESILRRRHCTFVSDMHYTSPDGPHLRSLPDVCWTSPDERGDLKEELIRYRYDETEQNDLVSRTQVFGHNTSKFGARFATRGNLTRRIRFRNPQTEEGMEFSRTQYDVLGNPVRMYDARGFSSTTSFVDRFGLLNGNEVVPTTPYELEGRYAFAFPSIQTNNIGMREAFVSDFHSGKRIRRIDWNGNASFPAIAGASPLLFGRNLSSTEVAVYNGRMFLFSHSTETGKVFADFTATRVLFIGESGFRTEIISSGSSVAGHMDSGISFLGRIDALGRFRSLVARMNGLEHDPRGVSERHYIYDSRGNLLEENSDGFQRKYRYDGLSRLISRIDPEAGETSLEFDENDNIVSTRDSSGRRIVNRYDPLNRPVSRWSVDIAGTMTLMVEFEYDRSLQGKGLLTRADSVSENGIRFSQRTSAYDHRGNPIKTSYVVNGRSVGEINHVFDDEGRLLAIGYPSGRSLEFKHDDHGGVREVVQSHEVNGRKRRIAADIFMDSQRLGFVTGNGFRVSQSGDTATLMSSTRVTGGRGVGLIYDLVARRLLNFINDENSDSWWAMRKTTERHRVSGSLRVAETLDIKEDPPGRLLSRRRADMFGELKRSFSYDQRGNRKTGEAGTNDIPRRCRDGEISVFCSTDRHRFFPNFSFDNRFMADQDGDGNPEFSYDAAGRLVDDSIGRRFNYDSSGRLSKVELPSHGAPGSLEIIRDAWGRVVGFHDTTQGITRYFLRNDKGDVVAELASEDKTISRNSLGHVLGNERDVARATFTADGVIHPTAIGYGHGICLDLLPECDSDDVTVRVDDMLVVSDDFVLDGVTGRYLSPAILHGRHPDVSLLPSNLYQRGNSLRSLFLTGIFTKGVQSARLLLFPPQAVQYSQYFRNLEN